jgi:3-methyladenine DNA glycosylase AlkD
MTASEVKKAIRELGNATKAAKSARFFKTGQGEYGEGDRFLGLTVPEQRAIAKRFCDLGLLEVEKLLESPYHEDRFTALEILVMQYERADTETQEKLVEFYLAHTARINNWDLVDTSAPYIFGHHLYHHPEKHEILRQLARSASLWERRIAIVSTLYFIQRGRLQETLEIAEMLLGDTEDLMHKACGWMLREVWKRSPETAETFLDKHAATMPRTMLRYAIERMEEAKRKVYLQKKALLLVK